MNSNLRPQMLGAFHAPSKPKTALCKNLPHCKFGVKCNFAHSPEEIQKRKVNEPCWWFNTTGCSKSEQDCVYIHTKVDNPHKPIHLQHPCVYYYKLTQGTCVKENCKGDHGEYTLTDDEWIYHFGESRCDSTKHASVSGDPRHNEMKLEKPIYVTPPSSPIMDCPPAPKKAKSSVWNGKVPDTVKEIKPREFFAMFTVAKTLATLSESNDSPKNWTDYPQDWECSVNDCAELLVKFIKLQAQVNAN